MKPFISFCLLLCICLGKLYAQGVNIVYIGNSITQGALLKTPVTEAPPVQASQYIEQATKQSVAFRNCGVSGTTTLDFLPIAERQFPNVKSAAQELSQRKGTLLFSIRFSGGTGVLLYQHESDYRRTPFFVSGMQSGDSSTNLV